MLRIIAVLPLVLGIAWALPGVARSQLRVEATHAYAKPDLLFPAGPERLHTPAGRASRPALPGTGPTYGRVLAGTTVGAIAGAAAGASLVAVIAGDQHGSLLAGGAVLGSIPGMYWGARIAGRREGNPWLTAATALGATALGFVAGNVVGGALAGDSGIAGEYVMFPVGLAVPLGLTAFVEWRTGRQ